MSDPIAEETGQQPVDDKPAGDDVIAEVVAEVLPAEQDEGPTAESLGLELPDDREEAVGMLVGEVHKARNDATAYLDDLQRVAADFDNYRKRTIRDQAGLHQRAVEKVVQGLLPVLDTFDAALSTEPETETEGRMYSGMLGTREQLLKALADEGLQLIPAVGETFDPEVHEPVGAPAGSGTLVVAQELRRGYTLNGKVVRAALVVLEIIEE